MNGGILGGRESRVRLVGGHAFGTCPSFGLLGSTPVVQDDQRLNTYRAPRDE